MNTQFARTAWGLGAVLSVGIALFSYRYLGPPEPTLSPNVLANLFARPWLLVHVTGAATALLVGGFQLLPVLRRRRALHRWLGRAYALGCVVGGAGGFALALGTTSGPVAATGFGLLAPLWIYVTVQGWRAARARRFDEHRAWMMRSFSLTFAAVTLRLYLPLGQAAGLPFAVIYPLTAWISWIPNLAVAEIYLRRRRPRPVAANRPIVAGSPN